MKKIVKNVFAIASVSSALLLSSYVSAQTAPVACKDYKRAPTSIIGERAGKKIQKALEEYNNDLIKEALDILYEIETKQAYDRAFTDNFIGKMLAGQDGKGMDALKYLKSSVEPKSLNDSEHAGTLRLVADLSMQEKEYGQANEFYQKWMTFTCKEDPDIYTRMSQAYYELKKLPEMIDPTNKAIALYEKPNKNPYVLKLQSYYERKMYQETVEVAEELVRIFPDNKQWWSQLGFFYMLVEDYKKALSTFEIAYNKGYLSKKSEIKALAQLYATNDIPYKSAVVLEKYIDEGLIEKDESSLASLANSWHQARNYKKAAGFYEQAANIKSEPDYYRKQGILLHAAEDYKGALKALQRALDEGADQEGRIHLTMMEAHIYTGNFKQAIVHVKEAKKHSNSARNARAWEPYIRDKAKNRGIRL